MSNEELRALSERMNAQDSRSTQLPLFVVQERVKIYSTYDADETERKEDPYVGDLCGSCRDLLEKGKDLPKECDSCSDDAFLGFKWDWEFKLTHGVFLLGEECDAYIERRRYEFGKEVRSYGISSYWSHDMGRLLSHLSSLSTADGKAASQYRV